MHRVSAAPGLFTMDESPQDGVQNMIEVFAHIFRQESQHEKSVLLQQGVFPPVPPVRFGISQMLRAVQFDYDAGFRAHQVHFHQSSPIKRNRQFHIEAKTASRCRYCLQTMKEERFAGAPRPLFTFRLGGRRARRLHE